MLYSQMKVFELCFALAVAALGCVQAVNHGEASSDAFRIRSVSCDVSMPPVTPVLGVNGDRLYYFAWHSHVYDAQSLKTVLNGSDVGVNGGVATASVGYAIKGFGSIVNPTGQALYKVDLNTLTSVAVAKIGFSNNSSVESLTYFNGVLYATVSTCFMCSATEFAVIDESTGALTKTATMPTGLSGLAPPVFDGYRDRAYFWAGTNLLVSVDLGTLSTAERMTMPYNNTAVDLSGQPAAVVAVPDSRVVGYLQCLDYNTSDYEFVIMDLDTHQTQRVPVPLPDDVKRGSLLSYGPASWSGSSLGDSYFYFVLSYFTSMIVYRVSAGSGHLVMAPELYAYMESSDAAIVAGPRSAFISVMYSGLPGNHHPMLCQDSSFGIARFGSE